MLIIEYINKYILYKLIHPKLIFINTNWVLIVGYIMLHVIENK